VLLDRLARAMRHLSGSGPADGKVAASEDEARALIEKGNAQEDLGDLEQARQLYEQAIRIAPTMLRAHLNHGNVLLALGHTQDAVQSYLTAISHQPDHAGAHFNLGNAQLEGGRPADALHAYEQALTLNPDFVDAWVAQGNVHSDQDDLTSAIASYEQALVLMPNYAAVHVNLGRVFQTLGRTADAANSFSKALFLKPDNPVLQLELGFLYRMLERPNDALACYAKAVALKPDYLEAQCELANVHRELGNGTRAIEVARMARDMDPNESGYWSLLLFCLSNQNTDKNSLFEEHRRFGEHFESQLRPTWQPHGNSRDPDRVLKVGFVSADLRDHAVASFFEPVLELLLKTPSLSIYIYNCFSAEDPVSLRMKSRVPNWQDIYTLTDAQIVEQVRGDGIDVLVDLSGHTPAHRLLTFARKPAPVQMSWMGYPGTTGLASMDYYVADRHFLPPGEADAQFTEKVLRIPVSAPFRCAKNAPDVNKLPAIKNGFITFGSFNRIDKIGRDVIALWAELLRACPNSKMFMAGMPRTGSLDHLKQWFTDEGVVADRLVFHRRTGMYEYLKQHHEVDVCLDTFPYGGGTTTCHAATMGVPTLTLVGSTPSGRAGYSILSHLGIHEIFAAVDPKDFLSKGIWCATHLNEMAEIRNGMRARFLASAFSKPHLSAEGVAYGIRYAWKRWCASLPVESFEVIENGGSYTILDSDRPIGTASALLGSD
jgi:protein O-GlcNAc transferase